MEMSWQWRRCQHLLVVNPGVNRMQRGGSRMCLAGLQGVLHAKELIEPILSSAGIAVGPPKRKLGRRLVLLRGEVEVEVDWEEEQPRAALPT